MRVCLVNEGKLSGLGEELEGESPQIVCISSVGLVDYEKEIEGKTGRLRAVAKLSQRLSCVVVCGCETDAKGLRRRSAIVSEGGRILGISDMSHAIDGNCNCGFGLKCYDTAAGRLGVLVGEDLYFPEAVKVLVQSACDLVLCAFGKIEGDKELVLMRCYSFCYGVCLCMAGEGYSQITAADGSVLLTTPRKIETTEVGGKRRFHLIETRRSGFGK